MHSVPLDLKKALASLFNLSLRLLFFSLRLVLLSSQHLSVLFLRLFPFGVVPSWLHLIYPNLFELHLHFLAPQQISFYFSVWHKIVVTLLSISRGQVWELMLDHNHRLQLIVRDTGGVFSYVDLFYALARLSS